LWSFNSVPVNKIFLEQPSSEPKVKVMVPMYEPLETSKCEKCGKIKLLMQVEMKIRCKKKEGYGLRM